MSTRPVSRYQRRILAWGAGLTCLLYVIGAPFYLDRVESDLTERVTDDLAAAGYTGFTVSFSGQTGSIDCEAPLDDPRGALDVAYAVRGVRSMRDLPDQCRVLTVEPDGDDGDDVATSSTTTTTVDESSTTTTTMGEPDFDSVLDVLGGNPQFSLLSQLVDDAGLAAELTERDPITFFAPTDSAFDALAADAVAVLRSDPELLRRVLLHHLVEARLTSDQLVDGRLTTLAGDEITVDVGGASPRVDGASIVEPDVLAANGVVHAIDELLLPADVDLSAPERLAPMRADYQAGGYSLTGTVRSEVERAILVAAASEAVGAERTVDELLVDPDLGLDEDTARDLATLVAAVPVHLVEGAASFDGEMLVVEGTYAGDAERAAITAIAATVDAEVVLTERRPPTAEDAVDLEAALNEIVVDDPILFEPSSAVLDESAPPILDEIAATAAGSTGLTITVEGHTDSDGDPAANLLLSQQRALVVRQALVDRGLDPGVLRAEGFGSTEPVLVDGVEDKDASRRVEFRVEVA